MSLLTAIRKAVDELTDDEIIERVIELRRMCGQPYISREELQEELDRIKEEKK